MHQSLSEDSSGGNGLWVIIRPIIIITSPTLFILHIDLAPIQSGVNIGTGIKAVNICTSAGSPGHTGNCDSCPGGIHENYSTILITVVGSRPGLLCIGKDLAFSWTQRREHSGSLSDCIKCYAIILVKHAEDDVGSQWSCLLYDSQQCNFPPFFYALITKRSFPGEKLFVKVV